MQISAQRNPAMSDATWQRFLQQEELDIVDYLLAADCHEVSIIDDGRLTSTTTRADLVAVLSHKVEGKPKGERWLTLPDDSSISIGTFLSLAHRVTRQTNAVVHVPLVDGDFQVTPQYTMDQTICAYQAAIHDTGT